MFETKIVLAPPFLSLFFSAPKWFYFWSPSQSPFLKLVKTSSSLHASAYSFLSTRHIKQLGRQAYLVQSKFFFSLVLSEIMGIISYQTTVKYWRNNPLATNSHTWAEISHSKNKWFLDFGALWQRTHISLLPVLHFTTLPIVDILSRTESHAINANFGVTCVNQIPGAQLQKGFLSLKICQISWVENSNL